MAIREKREERRGDKTRQDKRREQVANRMNGKITETIITMAMAMAMTKNESEIKKERG